MKREGEKSREALLVITVISMSFSERLDWSHLKSSSLTGNPQEDLSVKRNRKASGNKREEIGEGRMKVREKLDNSYVYTQNEFWSRSLAVVAVSLIGVNIKESSAD